MKLEEITPGRSLAGVEPAEIVTVVATVPLGDGAVQLIYRTPGETMKERLLNRADEAAPSSSRVPTVAPLAQVQDFVYTARVTDERGATCPIKGE